MKVLYQYKGNLYNETELRNLEDESGEILHLFPTLKNLDKISFSFYVDGLAKVHKLKSYHIELFPTTQNQFYLVGVDNNDVSGKTLFPFQSGVDDRI